MKISISLRSIMLTLITCAFLVPSQGLAITKARVGDINKFMADIKNNKLSPDQIEARSKELKRGLTAGELRSKQLQDMDAAVKKALEAKATEPSEIGDQGEPIEKINQEPTDKPVEEINKQIIVANTPQKKNDFKKVEEITGQKIEGKTIEFAQNLVDQYKKDNAQELKIAVSLKPTKQSKEVFENWEFLKTVIANEFNKAKEEYREAIEDSNPNTKIQELYEDITNFTDFLAGELKTNATTSKEELNTHEIVLKDYRRNLTQSNASAADKIKYNQMLDKAQTSINTLREKLTSKPATVDIIKPKLDALERNIEAFWMQQEKLNKEKVAELYRILGGIQKDYLDAEKNLAASEKTPTMATHIRKAYKHLGLLELLEIFTRGEMKEMSWDEAEAFLTGATDDNLFEALEYKRITEAQYIKALNARISLLIAATKDDDNLACANENWMPSWIQSLYINNTSYRSADDKKNIETIRKKCANYKKEVEVKEKEIALTQAQKKEQAYKDYIQPIEENLKNNPELVKALYQETSAFLNDLKKATASLNTDKIEMLDFKDRYAKLAKVVNEKTAGNPDQKERCQKAVLDPIAIQIKRFIIASIKAHRKITDLAKLHIAVRGEANTAVKALEFVWRFETAQAGTDAKIPMIQQIQTMNNALKELGLAFTDKKSGDDALDKEIANELFISFAYLLASFDSFTEKILTEKQGYFAWMGSWIAYMIVAFLSENRVENPYSKKSYADTFKDLIDKVGERIVNGIKVYDRALLQPILKNSTEYTKYNNGTWHIKRAVPALMKPGTEMYIYSTNIKSVAIPGSNKTIPVIPNLFIEGQHNKSKLTPNDYPLYIAKVREWVDTSLGQTEAAAKNKAEAAFKGLMTSIDEVRTTAINNNEPLSQHEAGVKDAIEAYQQQFSQE